MLNRYPWYLFPFLTILLPSASADSSGDLLLCSRNPTAALVGKYRPKNQGPCTASAKIQAIAYECGRPENNVPYTHKSFERLMKRAQEKCEDYCESLSSECTGKMEPQSECGFSIPENQAVSVGKNIMHCPARCEGQAFNYCSLYHADYLATEDHSIFNGMRDNCRCRKKAK